MRNFIIAASFLFLSIAASAEEPQGISFKETMTGTLKNNSDKMKCKLSLVIKIEDVDNINTKPGIAAGQFTAGKKKYDVTGSFLLMATRQDQKGHFLVYDLKGSNRNGESIHVYGAKHILKDERGNVISDATQLYGAADLSTGESFDLGLRFHWENPITMAKFLASFKAINAHGVKDELNIRKKFFMVWFGAIYEEYFKKNHLLFL